MVHKDIGPLYEQSECNIRHCHILNFNVNIKRGAYKAKHVEVVDRNKLIERLKERLALVE